MFAFASASKVLRRPRTGDGRHAKDRERLRGNGSTASDPGQFWAVAPLEHRDDIQGLRAVAVLLVALNHAGVGFLRGGYVGVDVFFVLSGFLITSILLNGATKRGYVSLTDFYSRRARRILPAASLTLVTTTIVAYELLNFVRAKQAAWDSFWASLFVANIRFAHQGTDYFARGQPPSVDQHYWSLSVEEQFYLVWPALLGLVVFGLVWRRRPKSRRSASGAVPVIAPRAVRRLLVAVVVAAAASLAWSIHSTDVLPAAAYFSTFARVWELALGAALAIASLHLSRMPASIRAVLGWVGLASVVVAAATFSSLTPFPGFAALLPTIGTALLIAAGLKSQHSKGVGRLLSVAPMRYIGDRSYAFYLWHWPVLIIALDYEGHNLGVGVNLVLLLGAFLLSMISYRFFEDPIRRARWNVARSAVLIPASVGAVVVATMVTVTVINGKILRLQKASAAVSTRSLQTGEKVARTRALPAVVAAVKAARRGAPIPTALAPPVSQLLNDSYEFPPGCRPSTDLQTTSNICRLGDSSSGKSLVLFGDSHAMMWMPTLLAMAQSDGWKVIPLVKSGCDPIAWTGPGYSDQSAAVVNACHTWYAWAVAQAKSLRPTVTLIAGCCPHPFPGQGSSIIIAAFASLATTMKAFSTSVVVLADDDGIAKEPVDCLLLPHATMRTCTSRTPANILAFDNRLAKVAAAKNFGFLKTKGWFCYQDQCPTVVANTIVYRDKGHLTKTYALRLVGPFREAFRHCILDVCPR